MREKIKNFFCNIYNFCNFGAYSCTYNRFPCVLDCSAFGCNKILAWNLRSGEWKMVL